MGIYLKRYILQMRFLLVSILIILLLGSISFASEWDVSDTVLLGNFLHLTKEDVAQTLDKVEKYGPDIELTPFTRQLVDKPQDYKNFSILATLFLANRWLSESNSWQRRSEMFLANLVEATMLDRSGYPWSIRYCIVF